MPPAPSPTSSLLLRTTACLRAEAVLCQLYIAWAQLPSTVVSNNHVARIRHQILDGSQHTKAMAAAGDLLRRLHSGERVVAQGVRQELEGVAADAQYLSVDVCAKIVCSVELSGVKV